MKLLYIFDLDGTLTKSKQSMDNEMASLLVDLLKKTKVAVVSGGKYEQFINQFVDYLNCNDSKLLSNLFLFPTCATAFYRYSDDGWMNIYNELLSEKEKKLIKSAIEFVTERIGIDKLDIHITFGKQVEDRKTQITFSALGQEAPLDLKKNWDKNQKKRWQIKKMLENFIPEFEITIGGTTSIDITKKGIDKIYAIKQMEKYLGIDKKDMLFIGDALYEGGNDYPVKTIGVECIQVVDEEETKKVIRELIYG